MAEPNTALADAFARAGYKPKESLADQLRRMMAEAIMAEGPGRGLRDPSVWRFAAALECENDLALMWELFAGVRDEVLCRLFAEVYAAVKAGEYSEVGDLIIAGTQVEAVPTSEGGAAAEAGNALMPKRLVSPLPASVSLARGAGGAAIELQPGSVVPQPAPRIHEPPGGGVNGMVILLKHQRESWLKRITIGNKPIANMNRDEVADAMQRLPVYDRFLSRIYQVWPAHADNQRVSEWLSDDEGDRLWEQAKVGHAA